MLDLDSKIKEASTRKVKTQQKIARGTLERFNATEQELKRLRAKRDNLDVQIKSLEAKQAARRAQLQNLTK